LILRRTLLDGEETYVENEIKLIVKYKTMNGENLDVSTNIGTRN